MRQFERVFSVVDSLLGLADRVSGLDRGRSCALDVGNARLCCQSLQRLLCAGELGSRGSHGLLRRRQLGCRRLADQISQRFLGVGSLRRRIGDGLVGRGDFSRCRFVGQVIQNLLRGRDL